MQTRSFGDPCNKQCHSQRQQGYGKKSYVPRQRNSSAKGQPAIQKIGKNVSGAKGQKMRSCQREKNSFYPQHQNSSMDERATKADACKINQLHML